MKELLKKKGFLFDVEGVLTDNIDEGHGLSNTANFISLLNILGCNVLNERFYIIQLVFYLWDFSF